jgi:hypothetical protein
MLGIVSLAFGKSNIAGIRLIRILRPLRTLSIVPGMAVLVSTVINSLP